MCRNGDLPGATQPKGKWKIPITAHAALRKGVASAPDASGDLAVVAAHRREEATRRLGHVRAAVAAGHESVAAGGRHGDGLRAYAAANGLSERTLRRWIAQYKDDGLDGLVDRRGGEEGSGGITPDAWRRFEALYLTPRQWSVRLCRQTIVHESREQGYGWQVPSLRVLQRMASEIPLPVRVLHREGMEAYNAQCAPYIQIDPDSVAPGAIWVGDHHQCNCWVRHRGRWVRPWLTAWQDMRSRALVGWHVSCNPNQTTILLAFKRGCESYGPPSSVKIDNGKDYDSELWTGTTKARRRKIAKGYLDEPMVAGLYAMLGISVSFSIPYHPQSKPIERFFDTFDRQFVKTMATYCGKDTARKPEHLNKLLERTAGDHCMTLDAFAAKASTWIDTVYHRQAHTGVGMHGRAPLAVLADRTSRRVVKPGVLDLMCRVWSPALKISKGGSVQFKGVKYGMGNEALIVRQGQEVRLAYDPDDMARVHVYDAATWRLITIAEQPRLVAYGLSGGGPVAESDFREAHRQKARAKKAIRAARPAHRVANTQLTDLAVAAQGAAASADAPQPSEALAKEGRQPPTLKPAATSAKEGPTLRPVATVLDDQLDLHRRLEQQQILRRAVGAEAPRKKLDFNLDALRPKEPNRPRLFGQNRFT